MVNSLDWKQNSNLEDSLIQFFREQIEGDSDGETLTAFFEGEQLPIQVRVGYANSDNWQLPVISLYEDSTQNPRPFVGTTKIVPEILLIIEVRGKNDRMRSDIARWVRDTINPGFPYYTYAPNPVTPNEPIATLAGKANVRFLSDNVVRLQNVDMIDQHRHRFSVSITIN